MDKYYLWKGVKVKILVKWGGKGPRNVLIEMPDGKKVVRPFRGLRKIKDKDGELKNEQDTGNR